MIFRFFVSSNPDIWGIDLRNDTPDFLGNSWLDPFLVYPLTIMCFVGVIQREGYPACHRFLGRTSANMFETPNMHFCTWELNHHHTTPKNSFRECSRKADIRIIHHHLGKKQDAAHEPECSHVEHFVKAKCRVWSLECEVWSVECRVWRVQCRVWSVKCRI